MDESGEHHPQQTDTRTENETPHILTHRRVLNNENTWTQGGGHHTLWSVSGAGEGKLRWGGLGGITWGEMPDIDDRGMEAANHIAMYVPMEQSCMICTCIPEPKVQFEKRRKCKV